MSDWVRVESQSTSEGDEVEYYYMNTKTKETTWDRPNVEGEIPIYGRKYTGKVKEEVQEEDMKSKPEDWWAVKTDSGEVYYMHRRTKTTTWDKPCEGEIEEYGKVYAEKKKEEPKEEVKTEKETEEEEDTKEEDDGDLKKSFIDVKNVEGLNPAKAPRRIALSVLKQKWVVRTTGEGGDDAVCVSYERRRSINVSLDHLPPPPTSANKHVYKDTHICIKDSYMCVHYSYIYQINPSSLLPTAGTIPITAEAPGSALTSPSTPSRMTPWCPST